MYFSGPKGNHQELNAPITASLGESEGRGPIKSVAKISFQLFSYRQFTLANRVTYSHYWLLFLDRQGKE